MSVTISNATLMMTVRAAMELDTSVTVRCEPQGGGYSLSTGLGTHRELGVCKQLDSCPVLSLQGCSVGDSAFTHDENSG